MLHRGLLRPRALICFLVFGTRVEALTLVCAYYVKNVKEYKCPRKKIGIFHGSVSFGFRDILKFVVVVVVVVVLL